MMVAQIAGWCGMLILLFAYGGRQHQSALLNAAANLIGSLLLACSCFSAGAIPATVLNILWSAIAIGHLIRSQRTTPATRTHTLLVECPRQSRPGTVALQHACTTS